MTHSQKFAALVGTGALALVMALPAACAPQGSSANAKAAALKELRDTGVITPQQYAQRMTDLRGSPAPQGAPRVVSLAGERRGHEVDDPQLGLAAFRVTTPADWRFQGEMTRQGQCATPAGVPHWRAEAPDGAYGVEVAALAYGMTTSQAENAQMRQHGCVELGTTQAEAVLRAYAEQRHPGGRIVSSQAFSDSDAMLQQRRIQIQNQMASLPPEMQGRMVAPVASGAQVKIAYSNGGRALEESLSGIDVCFSAQSLNFGGPPTQRIACTVQPLMIVDAPQGKLDEFGPKAMEVATQQENPAYLQAMAQRNGADRQSIVANARSTLARTEEDNTSRLNGIIATNKASIANIHRIGGASMRAAHASADALDRSSGAYARSLGDQAIYTDTDGRTFTGSNQYSHTYVDGRGHVMQTNSAYAPGPDWTETQPH